MMMKRSVQKRGNFLKGYTIPMIQLNPAKTILVISHDTNTFDKKKILGDEDRYKAKTY